jgi:tRNA(Ile)-lysidine synthase
MASSRKRPQSDLVERVRTCLLEHVPRGARVTLALSGGVDSIAALDLLARLAPGHPFTLACLHVNHGISPNAGRWARFARAAARRYRVRCSVRRVDLAPHRKLGLEGAARAARYAAFARANADFVVLAQHQDDQAETVLLQLLRGAGLPGLAAMPAIRDQAARGAPRLLRPLLGATRAEIEAYARARHLEWIEDESNADERHARNRLRRRVMPVLRELNRAAAANLARSAAHLAEAAELAQSLAEIDARDATENGRLRVAALGRLPPPRAKNVLRWLVSAAGGRSPDGTQLDEALRQLLTAREDGMVRVALGDVEVRRFRGAVCVVAPEGKLRRDWHARWDGRQRTWPLPELGGVLRLEQSESAGISAAAFARGPVEVRVRTGGERFQPDARRPRRTLKHLLQEAGVPPWERERLPLVYCGGTLAFVPGIGVAAALRARRRERGVVLSWQRLAVEASAARKAMLK